MSSQLPVPGEVFEARYRLERVLGEGGFARVFVATDMELQRKVAIKILRLNDDGNDDLHAVRFVREARHVAQLSHPNIVTMFEYGRTDAGLLFTVFELVGGTDLQKVMTLGRMKERDVIKIMLQVLDALSAAHESGLLHRDIKPANIQVFEYMDEPLRVKLLDFGIAKTTDGDAALTATGMVVGTPRYMAPEPLYNEPLGPFSDIYSLGLVAYEMHVGRPSEHMRQLVNQQPVVIPPQHEMGPGLRRVINRMLEREPTDRYASARAAMNELGPLLDANEQPAKEVAKFVAERPRPRRREMPQSAAEEKSVLHLALGAGATLAVVAGVAFWLAAGAGAPEQGVERPARTSRDLTQLLAAPKPDPLDIVVTPIDVGASSADAGPSDVDSAATMTGCGGEPPSQGTRVVSVRDGLSTVEWIRHVPRGYDGSVPVPLVILLHDDAGANPADTLAATGMASTADEHGFVLVVPEDDVIAYTWTDAEDIENIEFVVQSTRESMCIDPERVFAVGYGAGGWGVEALSCRPWLKGAATVSYVPEFPKWSCAPQLQLPLLVVLPTKSGFLPPRGGPDCLNNPKVGFDELEKMWRTRNGCSSSTSTFSSWEGNRCVEWSCDAPFVSCRLAAGRRWSGAPVRPIDLMGCDGPGTKFPHNETIWKFLSGLP